MVSNWSLSPGRAEIVNVTDSAAAPPSAGNRAGPMSAPPGEVSAPKAETPEARPRMATISSGKPSSAIRSVPRLAFWPGVNIGSSPSKTAQAGGESGTAPIARSVAMVPGVETLAMVTSKVWGVSSSGVAADQHEREQEGEGRESHDGREEDASVSPVGFSEVVSGL